MDISSPLLFCSFTTAGEAPLEKKSEFNIAKIRTSEQAISSTLGSDLNKTISMGSSVVMMERIYV